MSPEDFRRNFAQSYFGVQPGFMKGQLTSEEWDALDLTAANPLIPCTSPSFMNEAAFACQAILKLGVEYVVKHVQLPWTKNMDEDTNIMYSMHPRLHMVQHQDTCVFISRHPTRNYNRGHCPRYCSITVFNPLLMGSIPTSHYSITWHIYNPVQSTMEQAIDILESGSKVGVVIAPFLGLFTEEGRKYPRIAYRNEIVGFIQNNYPIVYEYTSEESRDYILKITGKQPKVK